MQLVWGEIRTDKEAFAIISRSAKSLGNFAQFAPEISKVAIEFIDDVAKKTATAADDDF